jgi:hypothetical protein
MLLYMFFLKRVTNNTKVSNNIDNDDDDIFFFSVKFNILIINKRTCPCKHKLLQMTVFEFFRIFSDILVMMVTYSRCYLLLERERKLHGSASSRWGYQVFQLFSFSYHSTHHMYLVHVQVPYFLPMYIK